MKIFEIQLESISGEMLYKSLVPEVHVQDKIDKLIRMNSISDIGAIKIVSMGDISDRYIQNYVQNNPK